MNWVNVFAMLPVRAAVSLEWAFLARMASSVLVSALICLLGIVLGVHWGVLAATVLCLLGGGAVFSDRSWTFARGEVTRFGHVLRANSCAPFGGTVNFEHVFVADQFCSQTRVLGDMGLLVTYLSAGETTHVRVEPVVRLAFGLAPYWVRFWQCIRRYREEKGWEFLFLAANQDAIASAAALHMDAHLSGNVRFSFHGIRTTGSAMARKVRASRMKASGQMDAQAQADDAKPLDQILREEEGKQP